MLIPKFLEAPELNISQKLSGKKILIPILFGVLAVSWLLFNAMQEEKYVLVDDAKGGQYVWVDSNQNGLVDTSDSKEFVLKEGGQFSRKTFMLILKEIEWTSSVFLALLAAIFMVVLRDLGYMYRIRVLTDHHLSWRKSFDVIMLWEFASALTPSVVGGSGVAIFILNRENINLGKSTATVFVTAMMDELFYILAVPIVFLLLDANQLFPESWAGANDGATVRYLFYLGYGFILLLTSIIILAIFKFPFRFKRLLMNIFSIRLLKRWLRRAIVVGDEIIISSTELKGQKMRYWFKSFGATLVSWTARFLTLNFIILAFVGGFNHLVVYGRQLVMWVIMLISPTPGSSGVAELALSSFFEYLIPEAMLLLVVAIIWRLLTYFPYLFIGVFVLPRWLKRTGK